MFCNGLCKLCGKCHLGEVVIPKEKISINQETVLPVSAKYELTTNILGKDKVRKIK